MQTNENGGTPSYSPNLHPAFQVKQVANLEWVRLVLLFMSSWIGTFIQDTVTSCSSLQWGGDLQSEHEQFLVDSCECCPVFITDYPASTKAFYARANEHDNGETVRIVMSDCV